MDGPTSVVVIPILVVVIGIIVMIPFFGVLFANRSKKRESPEEFKARKKAEREERFEEYENDAELTDFYGKEYKFSEQIKMSEIRKGKQNYEDTLATIKKFLDDRGLRNAFYQHNPQECIIEIENAFFLYVGLFAYNFATASSIPFSYIEKNALTPIPFVFELNYNSLYSANDIAPLKESNQFIYKGFMDLSKYDDDKAIAFERARLIHSSVDFDKIINDWNGVPVVCIVYEIKCDDEYAFAIAYTEKIEESVTFGQRVFKEIPQYEKKRKVRLQKMKIDRGIIDDTETFGLTCSADFIRLFKITKAKCYIPDKNDQGATSEERALEKIVYYITTTYIKSKTRNDIKALKEKTFSELKHEALEQYEPYPYVNGHQRWKNEYLLYKICKNLYGRQVVYQFRPEYLKTEKGQMSFDIYLSKYRIAIEYQGEQHFRPVDRFGGEEAFKDLSYRDRLKKEISLKQGIILIEFLYSENLTQELVQTKVNSALSKK